MLMRNGSRSLTSSPTRCSPISEITFWIMSPGPTSSSCSIPWVPPAPSVRCWLPTLWLSRCFRRRSSYRRRSLNASRGSSPLGGRKGENGLPGGRGPGNGSDFDYGYDYLHCPCCEYFKSHEAADLAVYFCLLDFPEHKLMGTGLTRTKTPAQGDDLCDFRFKKGRPLRQDWSTEVPKIKSAS